MVTKNCAFCQKKVQTKCTFYYLPYKMDYIKMLCAVYVLVWCAEENDDASTMNIIILDFWRKK